jgi:hypothetical protein
MGAGHTRKTTQGIGGWDFELPNPSLSSGEGDTGDGVLLRAHNSTNHTYHKASIKLCTLRLN